MKLLTLQTRQTALFETTLELMTGHFNPVNGFQRGGLHFGEVWPETHPIAVADCGLDVLATHASQSHRLPPPEAA